MACRLSNKGSFLTFSFLLDVKTWPNWNQWGGEKLKCFQTDRYIDQEVQERIEIIQLRIKSMSVRLIVIVVEYVYSRISGEDSIDIPPVLWQNVTEFSQHILINAEMSLRFVKGASACLICNWISLDIYINNKYHPVSPQKILSAQNQIPVFQVKLQI